MTSLTLKNITIDDLADEKSLSVYVLNNSHKILGTGQRIIFTVMVGGKEQNVVIPVTFVPVNIASQVPKKALLESSDFLRILSSRILKLVESDVAENFLETDEDAVKETQRLLNLNLKLGGIETAKDEEDDKLKNVRTVVQNIADDPETSVEDRKLKLKAVGPLNKEEKAYVDEIFNTN